MRSFHFWLKVSRPHHALVAGFATYVAALLSDGHTWFDQVKIAAPIVIMLGVIGASLFHYGGARDIYARKVRDRIDVENPDQLMRLGGVALNFAVMVAFFTLPFAGVAIAMFNAIGIVFYTKFLSRFWLTKNVMIAAICTTPVLLGWAIGHRLSPSIPWAIATVFTSIWAREILKDVADIVANEGRRVTLPIKFGVAHARQIAGVLLLVSLLFIIFVVSQAGFQESVSTTLFSILALALLSFASSSLFVRAASERRWPEEGLIIWGQRAVLLALFSYRLTLG